MKYNIQQLTEAFKKAPKHTKDGLLSDTFSALLYSITEKYKLEDENLNTIAQEIIARTLNITNDDDFRLSLSKDLGLVEKDSLELSQELISNIVIPIKNGTEVVPLDQNEIDNLNNLLKLISKNPDQKNKEALTLAVKKIKAEEITSIPLEILTNNYVCELLNSKQLSTLYKNQTLSLSAKKNIIDCIIKNGQSDAKRWIENSPIWQLEKQLS